MILSILPYPSPFLGQEKSEWRSWMRPCSTIHCYLQRQQFYCSRDTYNQSQDVSFHAGVSTRNSDVRTFMRWWNPLIRITWDLVPFRFQSAAIFPPRSYWRWGWALAWFESEFGAISRSLLGVRNEYDSCFTEHRTLGDIVPKVRRHLLYLLPCWSHWIWQSFASGYIIETKEMWWDPEVKILQTCP